jgi:hypothetical protein
MAKRKSKSPKLQNPKVASMVIKPSKVKHHDDAKGPPTSTQTTPPYDVPPKIDAKEAAPDYVIVTPPPPIDPHRGYGFLMIAVSVLVMVIGVYAAWPLWSPYVAEQFPALEYKLAVDPRVASLVGRLDALEAQTSGGIVKSTTISDMEMERVRLQGEVGQLLKRLDSIEETIVGVKQLVNAINDDATIGETKRAINQITQRLLELERGGSNVGELNSRLDRLETKSSQIASDTVNKVADKTQNITSLIGDLEGRVHSLEATGHSSSTTRADAAAIILAVNQLRKSNLTGDPFDRDTNALSALSKAHPDILAGLSILEKTAKSGAATITMLRAGFYKISGSIVNAENEGKENSWLGRTKKRIWSLISIRKTGTEIDEISIDAFVAQVEEHLRKGDLAAAVKIASQIEGVSELAAKKVEPWLKKAKNRLMVERAVASLHVYAVSLMAQGKNKETP